MLTERTFFSVNDRGCIRPFAAESHSLQTRGLTATSTTNTRDERTERQLPRRGSFQFTIEICVALCRSSIAAALHPHPFLRL